MKILTWIKDNFIALFDELSFAGSTIGARLYFSASLFSVFMFVATILKKDIRWRSAATITLCVLLLIAVQVLYFLISGRPGDRPVDSLIVSRSRRIFAWSIIGIFWLGVFFG